MSCTPLAKTSIYTIAHEEPRRYLEIYVDEHLRCVAIDLGDVTLLSLDIYPESVKVVRSELPNPRCVAMEVEGIELCEEPLDMEKLKSVESLAKLRLARASALLLCYRGLCSEIQVRIWVLNDLDSVLNTVCSEDLADLGYRGVELRWQR